jgi:hypothetical protein
VCSEIAAEITTGVFPLVLPLRAELSLRLPTEVLPVPRIVGDHHACEQHDQDGRDQDPEKTSYRKTQERAIIDGGKGDDGGLDHGAASVPLSRR